MIVNQITYEALKKSVQGFYYKFNTNILKWHIHKIFDYDYLLETAKDFKNFEEFYNFHTKNKQDLIDKHCKQMFDEAKRKGLNPTEHLIKSCFIVRLGNIYNGIFTENKILEAFSNLTPYIICTKTSKEIDTEYKVDAVIELLGVGKLAIQIKPYSFTKYDKGSELKYHNRFTLDFGPEVYYVLYKDKETIIFNNVEIRLSDKKKIIEQIEKILVYNS